MTRQTNHYPTLLSIAGSDSIGGAGIQADIKTATSLKVYAMTAVTALTAQNTFSVTGILPTPPDFLRRQLTAVCDDCLPDAVKIGMVSDAESVRVIADVIREYGLKNVVLDPVMVATAGAALSDVNSVPAAMKRHLFPLATLITPNLPEASVLLGRDVALTEEDAVALARECGVALLLKGGHERQSGESVDIFATPDGDEVMHLSSPWIETANTHGTGCSLSTAIASLLSLGFDLKEAVKRGKAVVYEEISQGAEYELGRGHGPLYFFNQF